MGSQENGLTLEALAQRLEALERENAELRGKVDTLEGSDTRRDGPAETISLVPRRDGEGSSGTGGRVSRKAFFGKAGAAAAAAIAAGMLLNPREARADNFDNVYTHAVVSEANIMRVGVGMTAITGRTNSEVDPAGRFSNPGGTGVWGSSAKTGYSGLFGQHTGSSGYGVVGDGTGTHAGVLGRNGSGEGVRGEGARGVVGEGRGLNNAGVIGRNPTGAGVRGEGVTHGVHGKASAGGTGVFGEGGSGYAGAFAGGKAQLRIVPKAGVGRPTSGSFGKGDVYMDSAANLFVCVSGTSSSSAARWVQVRTFAVS
jgi:hypothetical protein